METLKEWKEFCKELSEYKPLEYIPWHEKPMSQELRDAVNKACEKYIKYLTER